MNIEQGSGPITTFADQPSGAQADARAPSPGGAGQAEYCRKREQAERAAAKKSPSVLARRVHQELAEAYARLGRKEGKP